MEILKLEPLQLPELRRVERMPNLPARLTGRVSTLAMNLQMSSTGSFQDVLTLPPEKLLTEAEREEIHTHLAGLRSYLQLTPEQDQSAMARMLVCLTDLLRVLPSQRTSEAGSEARTDAYMGALDDVQYWAVEAAIRRWYKGNCGNDEHGRPYEYNWMPPPATLRRVSLSCAWPINERIATLEKLLNAVPYMDCTKELERGRAAYNGLLTTWAKHGDIAALTFDEAVKIGRGEKHVGDRNEEAAA